MFEEAIKFIKKHAGKGAIFFALMGLLGFGVVVGLGVIIATAPLWVPAVVAASALFLLVVAAGLALTWMKENQENLSKQEQEILVETLLAHIESTKEELRATRVAPGLDAEKFEEAIRNCSERLDGTEKEVLELRDNLRLTNKKVDSHYEAWQNKKNKTAEDSGSHKDKAVPKHESSRITEKPNSAVIENVSLSATNGSHFSSQNSLTRRVASRLDTGTTLSGESSMKGRPAF